MIRDEDLPSLIAAGIGEAIRNRPVLAPRTGTVDSIEDDPIYAQVLIDGDLDTTQVRLLAYADVGDRVLVMFTPHGGVWCFGTIGGGGEGEAGPIAFDDLTDATITSPTDGQIPRYNASSGQWMNVALPGVTPPPTPTRAQFLHTDPMPVSTSGLSGWPGTRPSGYVPGQDAGTWTMPTNEDPTRYSVLSTGPRWPQITGAGAYNINISYQYQVTGTAAATPHIVMCEVECMDRLYFIQHPWPQQVAFSNTVSRISGSHGGVVVLKPTETWSGWFRVGIYAPSVSTNQTSFSRLVVDVQRLPIVYS